MMRSATMIALALVFGLAAWIGARPVAHGDGRGTAATARHASITSGMDCNACHSQRSWKQLDGADGARGFDHTRTGFALTGRHHDAGCIDCHRSGLQVSRQCSGCHQDAHESRMGTDCARCHTPASWQSARAIELHRATRLPLTGVHALLDCATCHRATAGRRFTAVPADCVACHDADMRNPDVHPSHLGTASSAPFPRDCSLCHRASGWVPAVADPSTLRAGVSGSGLASAPGHDVRFPISFGRHRGLDCNDCHTALATTPQALRCEGCHAHAPVALANQHRGRAVPRAPQACLHCHPGGQAR